MGTFYGSLLPALVRQGHTVHAIVGSAFIHGSETHERDGVQVKLLDPRRLAKLKPSFSRFAPLPEIQSNLAAARALWEQADGGQGYDAIEVVDWGMLFAPWVAEGGPPALVRLHSTSGQIASYDASAGMELGAEFGRVLEASLITHADALVSPSHLNAEFWSAQTGRYVAVAPPPLQQVAPLAATQRKKKGFVAARLQEWKGPEVLARALRRMGDDAPTVEWAGSAVGHPQTGEPYDIVLKRSFSDVWNQRLMPLGPIPPTAVSRKQAEAAFVVVPSLWDVYNLSAAEAMQQRAVVVCSDGAGAVDLLEHGRTGFVFPAGDDEALAELMRHVATLDPAERARIGEAARETVAFATDPEQVAAVAGDHYAALEPAPGTTPSWIADAVRPAGEVSLDAFLSTLPVRALLSRATRRIREKAFPSKP